MDGDVLGRRPFRVPIPYSEREGKKNKVTEKKTKKTFVDYFA